MPLIIFNSSLLIGWLLVLVGGVMVHPGWGLAAAGLLLIVLAVGIASLGGVHAGEPGARGDEGGA